MIRFLNQITESWRLQWKRVLMPGGPPSKFDHVTPRVRALELSRPHSGSENV